MILEWNGSVFNASAKCLQAIPLSCGFLITGCLVSEYSGCTAPSAVGGGGGSVVPFINPDGTKGYAKLNSTGALMVDSTENGIPANDYQALAYDGNGNLSTITFKTGGVSGVTVATMTLGYDVSENLVSIATTL